MINEAVSFRHSLCMMKYWKQKASDLNNQMQNEIMVVDHQMSGLSHSGTELTEKQMKSGKPMPGSSNHGQGINYVNLIEKKDKIIEKYTSMINHYQFFIDEVEAVLAEMSDTDRKIIKEMYIDKKYTYEYIADKNGYSRNGLLKHVNKVINQAKSGLSQPK